VNPVGLINVRKYRRAIKKGQSIATGNIDEEKQNKITTQYGLDNTMRKQTQRTEIRHAPSYKQLETKTNRTSVVCGNSNGHHNTELRT